MTVQRVGADVIKKVISTLWFPRSLSSDPNKRVHVATHFSSTMDDHPDPVSQFFPDQDPDSVDLYAVLSLDTTQSRDNITSEQIKKAYRRLALLHHPDKHSSADEEKVAAAALKFQQVEVF